MASNHNNNSVFYNTRVFLKNVIEVSSEFSRNAFRFLPGVGPIEYHNDKCLAGRVVIITGANTGLGKETAMQFAKREAKVKCIFVVQIQLSHNFLSLSGDHGMS